MQQKKEEEKRQVENTTTAYISSIARRYQDTKDTEKILAKFIDDVSTGACLECGLVHSFVNIDEEARRRQQNSRDKSLARLFWEAAV